MTNWELDKVSFDSDKAQEYRRKMNKGWNVCEVREIEIL